MPYTHYGLALSVMFPVSQMLYIRKNTAYKKYPNAEFFLVHFFVFVFLHSVQMEENMDQK